MSRIINSLSAFLAVSVLFAGAASAQLNNIGGGGSVPSCSGGQFVSGPGTCGTPAGGGNVTGSGASTSGNVLQSNNTGATLDTATDGGFAITDIGRLTQTQTFSGAKTFSSAITLSAGGALSGTFSGNFTLSGVPILSGLSAGTCSNALSLDAGNHIVTSACSGGSGTVTSVGLSVPASSLFGVSGSPVTTSGTLGITTTGTSGGIPYFSSGTQLNTSAALTANALVIGGGAGVAPSVLGSLGTTTTVLHGNAAGAPTFGAVALGTDVSGNLPNANLASQSANTVLGALTATTPSGLLVPSCSTAASALIWTSGTGFGCNTISGSGTVNNGTAGDIAYYASTGTAVSQLAIGNGLTTSGGTLNLTTPPNDQSGAGASIPTTDNSEILYIGAHTYTMPAAATAGNGWGVCLLNKGAGAATVNNSGDGATFLAAGGGTSITIQANGWACPTSDGTNWGTPSYQTVTLPVASGGTGTATNTAHGVLLGEGTSAIAATAAPSAGQLLVGQSSADPAPETMSQDCTITSAGVITCTKTNNVAFTSAATTAIGTSGATIPLLNGSNTYSGTNTHTGSETFGQVQGTTETVTLTSNNYNAVAADCGKTKLLPTGTTPTVTLPNLNQACTIVFITTAAKSYLFNAASGGSKQNSQGFYNTRGTAAGDTVSVTITVPSASAATWNVSGDVTS